jgi:hypothetical protein
MHTKDIFRRYYNTKWDLVASLGGVKFSEVLDLAENSTNFIGKSSSIAAKRIINTFIE